MSVKKNFIYNLSYQILVMILPLITTPYISRVIGAEGVGIQSYTYSIANYFVLFAMLGVNNHGNRSIAMVRNDQEKLNRTFTSIYLIQAIMSILMIILYIIYIVFFAKNYKIIFIIQLIYIIGALFDINWFFFGMEQFKITVIRNTIIKLISVMSIFIFVKDQSDLYLYSIILALGTLISQLILWRFVVKYVKFTKVKFYEVRQHIRPMLTLFIPAISVSIYKIMDKIMLGSMSTVTEVGFFSNSERIISIPLGIITALGTVMLPKMSNLLSKGKSNEARKYIDLSLRFAMFISIGAMFGLIGVGKSIVPAFLGKGFERCIEVVSLLSITLLFMAWANVIRTQILIPKKKDRVYIISTLLGAIVNVVINTLLITKWGAIGAAIGTIFAEATVCIYQTLMVRKELDIKNYLNNNVIFIISGIIMLLGIKYIEYILGNSLLTGVIQIFIGGSVYCITSVIYMIIVKYELIINIINKRK